MARPAVTIYRTTVHHHESSGEKQLVVTGDSTKDKKIRALQTRTDDASGLDVVCTYTLEPMSHLCPLGSFIEHARKSPPLCGIKPRPIRWLSDHPTSNIQSDWRNAFSQ